jgi:hypothetical protein
MKSPQLSGVMRGRVRKGQTREHSGRTLEL